MTVQLLLFGITKDIIGDKILRMEISEGSNAQSLMDLITERYPDLRDLNSLALAVNGEYAQAGTAIQEKDELALIPPVSGG